MAFNNRWRGNSRASYPYDNDRYDSSYKKRDERNESRDRGRNMEPGRRDSRDSQVSRPPRSPHPHPTRKDVGFTRKLHIDTRVMDGPGHATSSSSSPATSTAPSTRPTPIEAAADKPMKSKLNAIPSTTVSPVVVKAKDPKLQEVYDIVLKWDEAIQERTLLRLRKEKLLREDHRRQSELSKVTNKVDDFAPFTEFSKKFIEAGKTERESVHKRLTEIDQLCLENTEKFASALAWDSQTKQAINAAQNELQKKFAEFQRECEIRASEQMRKVCENHMETQLDIRTLKDDRDKSTHALESLSLDFKTLNSKYSDIQSENSKLKQQLADLNSLKTIREDLDRLSNDLQTFRSRADVVEGKVTTFMEKVEELDMETYNEILETWINHDFKNKVFVNERSITALREDLHSFQTSATSRLDKNDSLTQDTRGTVEALAPKTRGTSEALQNPRPSESKPNGQALGDSQPALRSFVEEKLNSFGKAMQKTVAESGDACADMVDEVNTRLNKVETIVNTLGGKESPSKDPDMVARIGSLEQSATYQISGFQVLRGRVDSLEGQKPDPRIDTVVNGLAELEKKVRNFQETYTNGGAVKSDVILQIVRPCFEDIKRRFEALEMSIRTLDSQWSNVSSRQMADRILTQLDPYSQRTESQLNTMERELGLLRNKVSSVEQDVLVLLKTPTRLSDVAKAAAADGKKRTSPLSPIEDPAKRMKLANGQPKPTSQKPTSRSGSCNP
ncbi:hypothetical protein GGR54DRAFT_34995 [Hypoxylon sp. NC1633]|nr:hypothetical protein GGR54DRAFT_34995 [Hypoxylon sp. NC1633]